MHCVARTEEDRHPSRIFVSKRPPKKHMRMHMHPRMQWMAPLDVAHLESYRTTTTASASAVFSFSYITHYSRMFTAMAQPN